jgi:hypothetical protein
MCSGGGTPLLPPPGPLLLPQVSGLNGEKSASAVFLSADAFLAA